MFYYETSCNAKNTKIDPAIFTDNNFYLFHISVDKINLLEIVLNISERSQL